MTSVSLVNNRNSYIIRAIGHATGSTEVCAAVSCLMYTLAGWVEQKPERGVYDISDACAFIYLVRSEATEAIYELSRIGFLQLAESYPEFIRVGVDDE